MTKCSWSLCDEICQLRSQGNHIKRISEILGLHRNTIYSWLKKGEKARIGMYAKFYSDWQKATEEYYKIKPNKGTYNKRRVISGTTRQNVLMRDNYTCQICGATVKDGAKLEIDHIIPQSKGGTNDENNLQVLCKQCNCEKHNRSDLLHDKQKLAELKGV